MYTTLFQSDTVQSYGHTKVVTRPVGVQTYGREKAVTSPGGVDLFKKPKDLSASERVYLIAGE